MDGEAVTAVACARRKTTAEECNIRRECRVSDILVAGPDTEVAVDDLVVVFSGCDVRLAIACSRDGRMQGEEANSNLREIKMHDCSK